MNLQLNNLFMLVHTCVIAGLPAQDEIKDDETHMRKLDEEVGRRQGLLQGTRTVYQGLIGRMYRRRHLWCHSKARACILQRASEG